MKSTTNQRKEHLGYKLQRCRCHYLHSFSCLTSQICEILRKFELIAVKGHPRSLILVSIESAYATSY